MGGKVGFEISWAFPEEDLDHWHDYEGGFSSRVPVADKPGARQG